MSKTAQAIKSGVVMGGTAILSAVNGLTPHMAGAIDIMVVQQPDGTLKCSPFYVRFGKYTPMRSKDKKVQIFVNGEEACFNMHLGAYGQAYFAAETMEIVSDADDADELLTGMMSPSSGYSSDDEDSTPYANASMLSAVQQEVARLQAVKAAAAAAAEAGAGEGAGEDAAGLLLEGSGSAVGPQGTDEQAAGAGSSMPGKQRRGSGSRTRSSSYTTLSGSESDGETSSSSSSSSSLSDLPSAADVAAALQQGLHPAAGPGGQQVAAPPALPPIATPHSNCNAAAAAQGGKGRRARKHHHLAKRVLQAPGDGAADDPARARLQEMLLDNRYSIKMQSDASFVAAGAAGQQQQSRRRTRSKSPLKHDGEQQQEKQQQQQQQPDGSRLQAPSEHPLLQQLESVRPADQQQQPAAPVRHVGFQLPPPQQQQQQQHGASAAVVRAARAAGAAGANGVQQLHVSELPGVLLDSAASYSMDEVSEGTGLSRGGSRASVSEGGAAGSTATSVPRPQAAAVEAAGSTARDTPTAVAGAAVDAEPDAAAAAAAGAASSELDSDSSLTGGGMEPQPTLAEGMGALPAAAQPAADSNGHAAAVGPGPQPAAAAAGRGPAPLDAVQASTQPEEELVLSPGKASSLLSSSLKAQQHQQQHQQQQQQQQQQPQQQAGGSVALQQQSPEHQTSKQPADVAQGQQQEQPELQLQADSQQQPQTPPAAAPGPNAAFAAQPEAAAVERSPSAGSAASSAAADADATAILEDAAAVMPSGWGMHPDMAAMQQEQQQQQQQEQELAGLSLPADAQQGPASSSSSNSSTDTGMQQQQQQQLATPAATAASSSPAQQQQQQTEEESTTPAGAVAAAAAAHRSSSPVSMPQGIFAVSPPADSGYLGDSEAGALMGTSYEGATPRRAAAAAAMAGVEGLTGPGAGPLALGLAGFQLSLCGSLLRPGITPAEAQQVFETRRVSGQVWAERGVSLMEDGEELVVKVGANLYSWQVAAPMVVGMLAFGGKWDSLLGLDPTGLYPIQVAEDHAAQAAKKSSASSSWRLWPFTGWREPSATPKQQQQQQQPGSSPSQAGLPPAAAAASASASALQPSGGSFTNLKALLAPGSKSAPDRTAYGRGAGAAAAADGAAGEGGAVSGGGVGGDAGVAAGGAARTGSFMSTASSPPRPSRKKHIILIRKTLTPTSEQLNLLPLRPGANTITFRAGGAADLTAYIYLLRWNTRLVVSDVDGTITRSDLLGHVLPTLGVDWSHPGITQLFHNIARNGYQIMFLSSRAIAQANITREYLHTLVQNDFKMPSGPVIISPHGLLPSLYREIVVRRPHEFKIACLQDIRALFPADWNPFYAGFGNRDTDEVAYREVGVPLSRTFTINPKGQIQKASTAVQSSTWSSLSAINDLVDEMFPALLQHTVSSIARRGLGGSVYSSFTETLELAASLGAIQQEMVAAVFAEQQRRRSSSTGGGADAVKAEAAAAAAAAADADGGQHGEGQAEQAAQGGPLSAANTPTAAAAAAAAAVAAAAAAADDDGGRPGCVDGLVLENVGPAREEYNDLHFWRPSLFVNIDDELAAVSAAKQPQPTS